MATNPLSSAADNTHGPNEPLSAEVQTLCRALTPFLAGKRVLVTGAARGIGAAAARGFALAGATVALHYHTSAEAADAVQQDITAQGGTVHGLQGDFADPAAVHEVIVAAQERLGGLDVLINNAGTMVTRTPLAEQDTATMARIVDLNAMSVAQACRAALPALRRSEAACVINVASISARNGGSSGSGLYSASKAFVATLTRALASEWALHGIRVNAISPGTIMTDFHRRYSTPDKLKATAARIPLQRLGTAEDCLGTLLYLAVPPLSGYLTGQVIEINGGQLMP